MSGRGRSHLQVVPEYVDQVVRKERFLARYPATDITVDSEASPYERWRGSLPGCQEVFSDDLGRLLNQLEDLVAICEVQERWPGWTFSRIDNQWKAQEVAGTRVVFGPTLAAVEARVRWEEGTPGVLCCGGGRVGREVGAELYRYKSSRIALATVS